MQAAFQQFQSPKRQPANVWATSDQPTASIGATDNTLTVIPNGRKNILNKIKEIMYGKSD